MQLHLTMVTITIIQLAAPILNDLNIPATFYITTDFITNNSMSWIDMIEDSISKI